MSMTNVRFLNKGNSAEERKVMSGWYREQIDVFGTEATYYRANADLNNAETIIRGADMTSVFSASADMVIYVDAPAMNMSIIQFGWYNQDDITVYIHQDVFTEIFATDNETNPVPKSGDVIYLREFNGFFFEVSYRDNTQHPNANLLDFYTYTLNSRRKVFDGIGGLPPASEQGVTDSVVQRFNLPVDSLPNLSGNELFSEAEAIEDESNRIYNYEPVKEDSQYGGFDYDSLNK
jgi:hypothetical protein